MPRTDELGLNWSKRWSLTHRILAVNIFALAMLAGSLFYLDSFRTRLISARLAQSASEARIVANAVAAARPEAREPLLRAVGQESGTRLRLYARGGGKLLDSWSGAPPTYVLNDPRTDPVLKDVGRLIDNFFDAIVGARQPPPLRAPARDTLAAWPEGGTALASGSATTALRRAPDGTAFVSAAAPVGDAREAVLLITANAADIRGVVRDERLTLALILAGTIAVSVLLSLFLARTIVRPLRRLARAAQRVRLGRSRGVDVPRLPARRDEIGLLARALHDMTQALRVRIDATEAFAADVTHELKNPLASLRSAVDSLDRVEDAGLRRQLLDVVRADVNRLDRLIVDIAGVSRLDAELSRADFEPIDLGAMLASLAQLWEPRAAEQRRLLRVAADAGVTILGDAARLGRVLDNLVDNALSFSPDGGVVTVAALRDEEAAIVRVEDEGPGVPAEQRERIFERFRSIRPAGEAFGQHSGLGLAIAQAIVTAHDGTITVGDRADGRPGACFAVRLPLVS